MEPEVLIRLLDIGPAAIILVATLLVIAPIGTLVVINARQNSRIIKILENRPTTAVDAVSQGNETLIHTLNEISDEVSHLRKSSHTKDQTLLEMQSQITELLRGYTNLQLENNQQKREIAGQQELIDELRRQVRQLASLLEQVKEHVDSEFAEQIERTLTGLNLKRT